MNHLIMRGKVSRLPGLFLLVLAALPTPISWAAVKGEPRVPFNGVSLSVASPTVPPGGLLQMQISLTEPKPILKGLQGVKFGKAATATAAVKAAVAAPFSTSTSAFGSAFTAAPAAQIAPPSPLGAVRDVALFSPDGKVSGVAVLRSGGPQIFFSSDINSFGTATDTPVITIAIPVSSSASLGQSVSLGLDPSTTLWYGPNSSLYPAESTPGVMTVGGTLAVSDISPATGIIPAGKVIVIRGVGFEPNSQVRVNEATVATTEFVSSNEIHVTLTAPFDIRGKRVRIINSGHDVATYFPYQRTSPVGKSTRALVATSFPLFAQTSWTIAYFRPIRQGTVFTGLALQNLNAAGASITLQLFSKTGALLATRSLSLGSDARIVRDLAEYFPAGVPEGGTLLKVLANRPIQMLGMRGDDSSGFVLPVDPSPVP
jgi:hypothetical protein